MANWNWDGRIGSYATPVQVESVVVDDKGGFLEYELHVQQLLATSPTPSLQNRKKHRSETSGDAIAATRCSREIHSTFRSPMKHQRPHFHLA
jgi:hypothetical protein